MRIWGWGANTNGQLGLNYSSEQESSPTEVPFQLTPERDNSAALTPVKVTGGAYHTLLLAEGLREGFVSVTPNFQILPYPSVIDIASGWDFGLYLDQEGKLHSFGDNTYGQLGRSRVESSRTEEPSLNLHSKAYSQNWGSLDPEQPKLSSVSAGLRHAAGIGSDQQLYIWGDNTKHQLGNAGSAEKVVGSPSRSIFPSDVADSNLVKIRCGKEFTIALMKGGGCLYGSGCNKYGALLREPCTAHLEEFTLLHDPLLKAKFPCPIKDFQCGWGHVIALLENGNVMSWGRNNFGQLGRTTGNLRFDAKPALVKFPEIIIQVACGSEHSLALGASGKVYAWGWNEHDNCGVKSPTRSSNCTDDTTLEDCIKFPVEVPFPENVHVTVIGCSPGSSFAVSI